VSQALHPPLLILFRAFFARFFASETVTSDIRLRQTMIWVLAFLVTPGFILLIQLFPAFQAVVIRAKRFGMPGLVDDWLEWIVFVFVTYSMVTVGLIAVFVWDNFMPLATRALVAVPVAVAAAVLVSVISFGRVMQHAVSRPGTAGRFPARALRAAARALAGRHPMAQATADFVLLTIARNRAVHTPIAMNAALGVAIALAALTRAKTVADLTQPRTIVLWIPLIVGYWIAVGLRAATFVPSEPAASWIFRAAGAGRALAFRSGVRAATLTLVLPPALLLMWAVIAPLVGWRVAAWHTALVILVLIATVNALMLTMRHVPFTVKYRPGHAKLGTRWPLYAMGMFAVAVWPIRAELRSLGGAEPSLLVVAATFALLLHVAGRLWALPGPPAEPDDDLEVDDDTATVLNIGRVTAARHEPVAQPY
jgi:hypothetical protein